MLFTETVVMSSVLLLSFLGVSVGSHCPIWKEIAPCNCWMESGYTSIYCEKMESYDQVVNILKGKFNPIDKVSLSVQYSNLSDLRYRKLSELNLSIMNLKLNFDNLDYLEPTSFDGLQTNVLVLSLSDNLITEIPEDLWMVMPNIRTLNLGRARITELRDSNFKMLPYLFALLVPGNQISRMDSLSIPSGVKQLHIGRNHIRSLNGTLHQLSSLEWFFSNANQLTSLEGELPLNAPNFTMMHIGDNLLESLPRELERFQALEILFAQNNRIKLLDGVLANNERLQNCVLQNNSIQMLTAKDFSPNSQLETLILSFNEIQSMNNSLTNLKKLRFLNVSYNMLNDFSFQEIMGLAELKKLDISYNNIRRVTGPTMNVVDWNMKLDDLNMDNNQLEELNGAVAGLSTLLRLDLNHNKLRRIAPDDFAGLNQLRFLDISNNKLTTLENLTSAYLPNLEELKASHNFLSVLGQDFHGLPVLCHADLSFNQIVAISKELVSKTRCKIGYGVTEAVWDTLKINLEDNPIICNSDFPEISAMMEVNHTRLYGVAHCPSVHEQPTGLKHNEYLGYLPETTSFLPVTNSFSSAVTTFEHIQQKPFVNIDHTLTDGNNNLQIYPIDNENVGQNNQYQIGNNDLDAANKRDQLTTRSVEIVHSQPPSVETPNQRHSFQERNTSKVSVFETENQEDQLSKLASDIEELKTKVEHLASQNQLLLSQQLLNRTEVTFVANTGILKNDNGDSLTNQLSSIKMLQDQKIEKEGRKL